MSLHQVCFVVGARPNFMKAAPVHRALAKLDPDIELLLVHTGQHYDAEMSAVFMDELELSQPDVRTLLRSRVVRRSRATLIEARTLGHPPLGKRRP